LLKSAFCGAFLAISVVMANPAAAQVQAIGPTQNRLNVTFTGTVTNDVINTIRIRQPDGTTTRYSGPVPEYPYQRGDTVQISFETVAPNRNFYNSPAYTGQIAADGIYRIQVTSPISGISGTPGYTNDVDVSGPIGVEGRAGAGPIALRGITLVYDSNADTYSLELASNGWSVSPLDAPTYTYDATTGILVPRSSACIGPQCESSNIVARGDANNVTIGVPFSNGGNPANSIPIANSREPTVAGFFDAINLSGAFNFSIFGSSSGGGGPVDVPEPSTVLLFGAGAAAVMCRRRKKLAA
jgi:hypothetical protein